MGKSTWEGMVALGGPARYAISANWTQGGCVDALTAKRILGQQPWDLLVLRHDCNQGADLTRDRSTNGGRRDSKMETKNGSNALRLTSGLMPQPSSGKENFDIGNHEMRQSAQRTMHKQTAVQNGCLSDFA